MATALLTNRQVNMAAEQVDKVNNSKREKLSNNYDQSSSSLPLQIESKSEEADDTREFLDKPPTAYILYFREKQALLLKEDAYTSPAEISKTAIEEWSSLNHEEKSKYKVMAEEKRQEYIKSVNENKSKSPKPMTTEITMVSDEDDSEEESQPADPVAEEDDDDDLVWDDESENKNNSEPSNGFADTTKHSAQSLLCSRFGCSNLAQANREWDSEFCSSDCVVRHCKFVFENYFVSCKNS
ncbi:hypothetical protein HDE_07238 [Halotydeus destructor]|nr:hypothetical protein HDE_07238 [Halotydeus destructor]